MNEEQSIDPGHDAIRKILRVVGPLVAAAGLGFLAVGVISFFSSFSSGTFEPPRYFWCAFVAIPLLGIGTAITKFAYLGALIRYVAGESAPVGKDTFNYLAHGMTPGVRDLSRAAGEGFAEGTSGAAPRTCPACGASNPDGARFCNGCGAAIAG